MQRALGMLLVIVSAAGFGTLAIFGAFALADGMDSLTILFLRFFLSSLFMVAWMLLQRRSLPRGRVLAMLVGMGAIGYVGTAFCYFSALEYASPGLVALLLYLYPVIVVVLSALFFHERMTPSKLAALALAMAGIALTVGPAGGQLPGVIIATIAATIFAVYILVGARVLREAPAMQSSTVIFVAAAAMSGLLMAVHGARWPESATGWAAVAGIVVLATLAPMVGFLAGLERVGATNAAMLSTVEPVVTVLLAALLLDEMPQPSMLLGGALILVAVLLLARGEMRRPAASARLTGAE